MSVDFDGYFEGLDWRETLDGLRQGKEDPIIAGRGLDYLRAMLMSSYPDSANIRNLVGRNDGCELAVEIFRMHSESAGMFGKFSFLACQLALRSARNSDALVKLGCCEIISGRLEALVSQGNNYNIKVVANALKALLHLSLNSSDANTRLRSIPNFVPVLSTLIEKSADEATVNDCKDILANLLV